ncbi:hypothetical protein [Flaviaesturariibacter aridisoli]|uniref:Carboxypeptidase-like regulatory domain-containing protein n=1 Tax=Flaviaesturariibacter aridisoli TaxID=2545761 RepID=A0A4V2WMK6_9BACT|nr:hypothetical protein [Flaviaesturariibacter aridisoli]TCZ70454.1 hypothetical protein E0486_10890 [Flaviaesturariibacter aridisoli]
MFARRLLPLLALLQLSTVAVGQATHRLRDRRTGAPVPWATIKVLNRPQGAVANGEGFFELTLNGGDTALISSVGYAPKHLTQLPDVIDLEPVARPLDTVRVRQTVPVRTLLLGNGVPFLDIKLSCSISGNSPAGICFPWGVGNDEGKAEFAERMELPDSTRAYRLLRLWLPTRKTDCYGKLLVHLYAEDPLTGGPGEELWVKLIEVDAASVRRNRLKILVDLTAEAVQLPPGQAFFVSTGWPPGTPHTCFSIIPLFRGTQSNTWRRYVRSNGFSFFPSEMNWVDEPGGHAANTVYAAELEERVYK